MFKIITLSDKKPEINLKKILIVKNCCIGDVLMTTPLLKTLAINYPNAKIDYMVGDWSKDVLENNLYINKIYPHLLFSKISISNKIKKFREIKKSNYDIIFVLDIGIASILFSKILKGKHNIGFNVNNYGRLFSLSLERNPWKVVHEIDYYLNLSRLINHGIEIYKDINFNFSENELFNYNKKFSHHFENIRIKIGLFPGGGQNPYIKMNTKRWLLKNYIELNNRLNKRYNNLDFFVFGDKNDALLSEEIKQNCSNIILLAGKITIRETSYFISKLNLFLTNDSSLMHLASAFNIRALALFGPTNPLRLCPFNIDYIWHKEKCSPCFIEGKGSNIDCHDNICMKNISVNEVYNYIDSYVEQFK